MAQPAKISRLFWFSLSTVAIYSVLQAIIILLHEYAHSTSAWLLGYSHTPFTVVWGNLLTIRGWDEGVAYDRLFPTAGHSAEAVIGGIPLFIHALFAGLALYFFLRLAAAGKFAFLMLYWFAIVNLTELVAYILMRPFTRNGDTGHFNRGLSLSPWILFVIGTLLLLSALAVILRRVLPKLAVIIDHDRSEFAIVTCFTAFVMFLWGSGLRFMSLYPDPQWKWGLIGLVGFLAWIPLSLRRLPHT